jgi:membrane protease YdiL (CAAX protease family)
MKDSTGKGIIILSVLLATILFSVFRMIHSFFPVVRSLGERDWSLLTIILMIVLILMISAGVAVLIILPLILGFKSWQERLFQFLKIDLKTILTGLLSFAAFCLLAAVISLGIGIFKGDLSVVLAYPDIGPDPDVTGWGFFILALIPGIWEELAFRGLIQSKLQTVFTTKTAVFLSSLFFALFHLSNIFNQAPQQVVLIVIMAFFFGLGWGYMTLKSQSVIPAMISHYLVDSVGQIFLRIDISDQALTAGFFISLTLLYPVLNTIVVKLLYRKALPEA